jgi:hypothetical protein
MDDLGAGAPGANSPDPLGALKAQLAAQAQSNPGLAVLLQLMEQRPAAVAEERRAEEDAGATIHVSPDDERMRADMQVLVQGAEQLSAEVDRLRQRTDALAAALGACHLCFGEDAWCPHCGGRGKPGSRRPEPCAFSRYVRPVLQRMQRAAAAPRNDSTAAPQRAAGAAPDSSEGLRTGVV